MSRLKHGSRPCIASGFACEFVICDAEVIQAPLPVSIATGEWALVGHTKEERTRAMLVHRRAAAPP